MLERRTLRGALLLLLLAGACRFTSDPPPLTGDAELNAFVRELEAKLEAHAWHDLIAAAGPDHYRTQVIEHGMSEPQYVAELFGLHRVDNDIRRGRQVEWSDLERIRSVDLQSLSAMGAGSRLSGSVTLRNGSILSLRARIERDGERYVLTGAVG